MSLQRLNKILRIGMIGNFILVFLFSLLTLVVPAISMFLAILIITLMIITLLNFVITTIWLISDINIMMDNYLKYNKYE